MEMQWKALAVGTLLAAVVLVPVSETQGGDLVYFGATVGGPTGATVWKYDTTTNTASSVEGVLSVSYTHLRAHET